jgi:hypothetical protein
MQSGRLFRQKAIAKLSSPEQLDQLITVTDPRGWIALIVIMLIIITFLTWSFFAKIPIMISGNGILITSGGVHNIVSLFSGQIKEIKVKANEMVEKDQVIAIVSQPELEDDLELAKSQLKKLKEDKDNIEKNQQLIREMEFNIERFTEKLNLYSQIRCTGRGIVSGIRIMKDDYVTVGQVVGTYDLPDEPVEAVMFIPASVAKKLKIGMEIQISPSTVQREEMGFIKGKISLMSNYPITRARAMSLLENEELVNFFFKDNLPILIIAELEKDPDTISNFKWSSGKGPDFKIVSGTICSAHIILKQIHPISFIFPYFN